MNGKAAVTRLLRRAWAAFLQPGPSEEGRQAVQPHPEAVFLFASLGPEAREAFEVFPDEARSWRVLAEMEAARSRVWSG